MSQQQENPQDRLAEALRAQATRAPGKPPEGTGAGSRYGLVSDSNFELLSGTEYSTTYPMPEAAPAAGTQGRASKGSGPAPLAAAWILLLALLLGVVAGAIAGAITLL